MFVFKRLVDLVDTHVLDQVQFIYGRLILRLILQIYSRRR